MEVVRFQNFDRCSKILHIYQNIQFVFLGKVIHLFLNSLSVTLNILTLYYKLKFHTSLRLSIVIELCNIHKYNEQINILILIYLLIRYTTIYLALYINTFSFFELSLYIVLNAVMNFTGVNTFNHKMKVFNRCKILNAERVQIDI